MKSIRAKSNRKVNTTFTRQTSYKLSHPERCTRQTLDRLNYTNSIIRRVWRCQRGNQNSYIGEEQTTQWSKEKYK